LSVILAVLAPLRPYLIQLSVDKYIDQYLLQGLITLTILHLLALLVETGTRFWFLYRINWLGQSVVSDLRRKVFTKIMHQDIAWFDKSAVGTLTTRTINDVEAVNDVFSEGLISIVADVLTILAIITAMLLTDWQLTLICLSTFPVIILATYIFKESVHKSFTEVRNAVAALNAFVQEHISGMMLVQAFAAEKREYGKFQKINKQHKDANIRAIFAYSVFFPVVEIVLAVSMGLLVWWGAVSMLHYQTTPGIIVSFVMYLNLLFRPLRMLADKFNVLQMGMVATDRVAAVLDDTSFLQNNGSRTADGIKGDIEFKDVRFSYKADVPVLKGISFRLEHGKTMAIVGHTGAGKTSIISLLNRLYNIDGGSIEIDGHNILEYDVNSLRQRIGIVLQDVFLFSGTVLENITLRNDSIPRKEVEKVTRMLGIHEFIQRLPGGFDFNIMERGNTLSQGQRQLFSFARALLYNPAILVLDEATSSVDSESEQLIQKAIDTLTTGRTSIIIAHRLSTIRKADKIIMMDKGRIIESGTHQSLLQMEGAYYQLYNAALSKQEAV
jgi:ATP-binding cassette subfamily B multidrug efflux pump